MPLTAHLEELRWRIVRALLAVGVAFACSYWFAEPLFALLTRPLEVARADLPNAHTLEVIGTGVTEAFFTKLKVSFIAAVFIASPVIFYQAWRFVAPGLYESEKRLAIPFTAAATAFFSNSAAWTEGALRS